jgi:hypothetical protein
VLFNITNVQWFTGVLLIQQALLAAPSNTRERVTDLLSVLVVGLTGPFVIAWQSYQDGSDWCVMAQRYAADGVPVGTEFRVNTYTSSAQSDPDAAFDAAGGFTVVWQSAGQDGSGWVLYDNALDPYQTNNLIGKPEARELQEKMDKELQCWLERTKDDFATADVWKKRVDARRPRTAPAPSK